MTPPAIRVTQYRVAPGEFIGTQYVLKLNRALLPDYFVMISPGVEGNGVDANEVGVVVQADPFATGGLSVSAAADEINLIRLASGSDWTGTIQIVEAERDRDGAGFRLRDVAVISAAASTGVGLQLTQQSTLVPWADIGQVVLFGGWRGGGAAVSAAGLTKYPSVLGRLYPSGDDVINLERWENTGAGSRVDAALFVVYAVEWGAAWEVQRVNVTGGNFGLGTVVGEWNAATIVTTTRDETWIWGSGYTEGEVPGDGFTGAMLALGDGVAELADEVLVAVNYRLDPVSSSSEIWVLSHPQLAVDWTSQAGGRGVFETFDQPVDPPIADEALVPEVPHLPEGIATGRRLAMVTASSNAATTAAWPAATAWTPLFIADAILNIQRFAVSQASAWASRIQSIDFGGVLATSDEITAGPLTVGDETTDSTTELVYIPNHPEIAVSQLLGTLQKPRICSLVEAMATGVQVLEDLGFQLIVDRTLATATGAALDQWGETVGEQRGGLSDPDYRLFITARIAVNESGGSTDELIRIWQLVTSPQVSVLEVPLYPAGIWLQVIREEPLSDEVARRVGDIMRDAKPSGVSLELVEAVIGYFGFLTNPDAEPLDVGLFARSL